MTEKNNSMAHSHNSDLESSLHKQLTTIYTTHIVQEFNIKQYMHKSSEYAHEFLAELINNAIEYKEYHCIRSK